MMATQKQYCMSPSPRIQWWALRTLVMSSCRLKVSSFLSSNPSGNKPSFSCYPLPGGAGKFSTEATKVFPWASAASLQTELIELQENLALQESHCDPVTFWTKMVTAAGVPLLQKMAIQILTMFPSTYCCESAFSTMNMEKNAYRSTLTNEHLHQCLRLALTPFMPKFKQLVEQRRCHLSH
ncbi:SCAN domain-containing protein 3 [Anabarilius grahami]|uniref:SCAN domain-containing protein 3 n=1 Tax=Anabarilius grahami TaxID=495550 RepID=A0A3N0YGA8_ANAGA|nr:SCAN domain-containing protein 3 [Anabarilius grahami]